MSLAVASVGEVFMEIVSITAPIFLVAILVGILLNVISAEMDGDS